MGFTRAAEEIQHHVALTVPGGKAPLLDAVYMSLRQMKRAHHARKALLVISDGGDNHRRFRVRDVESLAGESDVKIYPIGIADTVSIARGQFDKASGWLCWVSVANRAET
jgi:Ca-activated chloride channel family protein